ncbi:MAG: hypothetical protein RL701_705 [Pseudomonadota bacterium]
MGIAVPREYQDTAAHEIFDVVVFGFDPNAESPVAGLTRVFGIDRESAHALVAALPAVVCRGVNNVRAEFYCRALRSIGGLVEVRDQDGNQVTLGERPRRTSLPATSLRPSAAGMPNLRPSMAPPSAAAQHSVRGGTLQLGSAATLNATPAPTVPAREPTARNDNAQAFENTLEAPAPMVEARPAVAPQPAAAQRPASGWGELLREPIKPARAVAPPLQLQTQHDAEAIPDAASYGALSLPPTEHAVALQSFPAARVIMPAPVSTKPAAQPAAPAVAKPAPTAQAPQRVAQARPAQPQPSAADPAAQRVSRVTRPVPASEPDRDSYWEDVPAALLVPFRGSGVAWIASIALWTIVANVLSVLGNFVPLVGTTFVLLFNTAVLALCADYHRQCLWAVANDDDTIEQGPEFDPTRILHGYMRAGVHLTLFLVASQLPLVALLVNEVVAAGELKLGEIMSSRLFWLLAIAPAFYWPMAVTSTSLYGRFQAVWYVPAGVRAIMRAPLEYASIALIGAVVLGVSWLFCSGIGRLLGLPTILTATLAGVPLAISHGVMGALTGQLLRVYPKLFE